jgi:hypothetical protein
LWRQLLLQVKIGLTYDCDCFVIQTKIKQMEFY